MYAQSIELVWITVRDLKKAVKFYTEIAGLKLLEMHEEWGWAELSGYAGGARLGIGQMRLNNDDLIQPGQNAVMTFTVEDIEVAIQNLSKRGADLVGEKEEVPGKVKLQMIRDPEGNYFQIVEVLSKACHEVHEHIGCCH
jgi:predicted enzyme related to lactoylglutathione lyase